jgi:phenylacetate-CoA ligase
VRSLGGIAEYQVHVDTSQPLAEMQIRIEPEPAWADSAALARHLEQALESAFGLRVPVSLAPTGSLPRFELKAMRWVKGAGQG